MGTHIGRSVSLAVLVWLAATGPARAHDLGAECELRGDRVHLEAYYDDNTPAEDARVEVTDAGGQVVAWGRTDERGIWSFARPAAGAYRVLVDAGVGHRKTVTVTVPLPNTTPTATSEHPVAQRISAGPTRQQFTSGLLRKVGVGVGGATLFGLALWLVNRRKSPAAQEP